MFSSIFLEFLRELEWSSLECKPLPRINSHFRWLSTNNGVSFNSSEPSLSQPRTGPHIGGSCRYVLPWLPFYFFVVHMQWTAGPACLSYVAIHSMVGRWQYTLDRWPVAEQDGLSCVLIVFFCFLFVCFLPLRCSYVLMGGFSAKIDILHHTLNYTDYTDQSRMDMRN